jgi:23S rRNA (adenine-N6)-dimethyltransferase
VATSTRRWGWYELDRRWAERIVADAHVPRGALVVDIGAGAGALTAALLDAGARVVAVEAHPDRARVLRERFADAVVVQADARDLRLPRRPFHVVANPPFDITAAILRRLLQPGSRLVSAYLVLQDQAARRWASPDAPGATRWRRAFDVSVPWRVPRQAFTPRPHVNTHVLRLERR